VETQHLDVHFQTLFQKSRHSKLMHHDAAGTAPVLWDGLLHVNMLLIGMGCNQGRTKTMEILEKRVAVDTTRRKETEAMGKR
jgi:hypothetical protein